MQLTDQKLLTFLFTSALFILCFAPTSEAQDSVKFGAQVRPILAKNCLACHGRDESTREADLRLDERQTAISSGAIVPGNAKASTLIQRIIAEDEDIRMPPPSTGHSLRDDEKKILTTWVEQGAPYEKHWAFDPPRQTELPTIRQKKWPLVPLDHHVLSGIEKAGHQPAPDADRFTWLRRVSLDLTGLPPTVEAADRFAADQSKQAYAKVVDELLKSKAFGEHWARMWLDLARYADTKGYEKDRHRDIWRYRDWVIQAFNDDMPFDQFTEEQLAGDLLPRRTTSQILATAFHRNTMTNEEGGTDNEEFRVAAVKDRVDTTIQVWMGLTMGCSKCHSHKYDPISVKDYYSFYAFFNQTQDNDTEGPFWPTPTDEQQQRIVDLKERVAQLESTTRKRSPDFKSAFADWKKGLAKDQVWNALKLEKAQSDQGVEFTQKDDGIILAAGERPDKDNWLFTFDLDKEKPVTSIRIDHLPKSLGGGDWPDANVALQELSIQVVDAKGKATPLKLKRPRASFSQRGWEVAKAIDGNLSVGWALSPKFEEQQVAVFDFEKPTQGKKLLVKLQQNYGQSLLLARSRFSVSTEDVKWNRAEIQTDWEDLFAREVYEPTKKSLAKLNQLKAQLTAEQKKIPKTPVMLELDTKKQRTTKIHSRGNFLDQTETVTPTVLNQFGPLPTGTTLDRRGVAKWLMSAQNPLTARVMVNRVWARLFGVGIVETEEDFGTQGLPPSNQGLLDALAIDFRQNGWSVKKLLRQIVLSRTYRQSSKLSPELLAKDPRNRLLARGPRFRLSAETIRDQSLAASGLLTQKVGGPSVMPPQPGGVWKSTYNGGKWVNATGPDRYRRALYTYLKRTSPYPALQTFDAGSGEVCQVRRVRTNTPLQALVVLNDQAFVEASGALAQRMDASSNDLKTKLITGFRRVLIRHPSDWEVDRLMKLYQSLDTSIEDANQLLKEAGLQQGDAKLVVVANVLLNLDEAMTKP